MLQQTRARAVIPYYRRFLERFPSVEALAAAREEEVLALWSGLGYYSRARNLRRAAVRIAAAGGFPRDNQGIRALPGAGDYTAAAIASMAFQLPYVVVDGNVLRVVARVENDSADIAAARTRCRKIRCARSARWRTVAAPARGAPRRSCPSGCARPCRCAWQVSCWWRGRAASFCSGSARPVRARCSAGSRRNGSPKSRSAPRPARL
jgi:endonuclease III